MLLLADKLKKELEKGKCSGVFTNCPYLFCSLQRFVSTVVKINDNLLNTTLLFVIFFRFTLSLLMTGCYGCCLNSRLRGLSEQSRLIGLHRVWHIWCLTGTA